MKCDIKILTFILGAVIWATLDQASTTTAAETPGPQATEVTRTCKAVDSFEMVRDKKFDPMTVAAPIRSVKNAAQTECAMLCSTNLRCFAVEYLPKDRVCNLYDVTALTGGKLVDNDGGMVGAIVAPKDPKDNHCLLLIGGDSLPNNVAPVEYYHSIEGVECNIDTIGNMSTERVVPDTYLTSGCYLSATREVVIREMRQYAKPPMVYGLKDGSAKPLPLPYSRNIYGTTAASVGSSKCISCGGYDGSGYFLNECYQFDPSLDESKWTSIGQMPYRHHVAASVSLTTNDFYVMGGMIGGGVTLNQLYRFNVGEGTWHQETSMSKTRYYHAAAALSENEFIVCGGYSAGGGGLQSTCEIYDATRKKWNITGSLNQARQAFVMTTLNGDIYALGGDNGGAINTVEKYDRATGEWEMAKAMQHPRSHLFAVGV